MKKIVSFLASAVGLIALSACGSQEITPNNVIPKDGKYEEFDFRGEGYLENDYFAPTTIFFNVKVGEEKQIEIDSFPTSYAKNSVNYASENEEIATVSESGVITGVSKGVADILITSKDKSISRRARVAVSEPSSAGLSSDVITEIKNRYEDPEYKKPTKVIRYEYSYSRYICEGVIDHGFDGYEVMAFDEDEGYFMLEGPTLYHKTPHGTPEIADGKWIMYPINYGIYTRLIHITPTAKNYFDINTAAYENYGDIIRDIMNFFFVDGQKIVDDLLNDYDGAEEFVDFLRYSATKYHAVDDNSLVIEYHQEGQNSTVSYDDEINYVDIPAGTVYSSTYDQTFLNSDNRTIALNVQYNMYYERDGKNWERHLRKSQVFGNDFPIEKIQNPKDNGYKAVDSLYDL